MVAGPPSLDDALFVFDGGYCAGYARWNEGGRIDDSAAPSLTATVDLRDGERKERQSPQRSWAAGAGPAGLQAGENRVIRPTLRP
jgi:hypothetical protein